MKRVLMLSAALTIALCDCKPQATPETSVAPAVPNTPATPATPATPSPESMPAPAVEPATPVDAAAMASLTGYGDMKLGSSVDDARTAWAGELNGKPAEGSSCYYLTPKWVKKPSDFAFMMEAGKFVRYDVGNSKEIAPGGGKVGMTTDELQKLYANSLQSAPHKYVEGGHTLSLAASGVAPTKLVFETDAAGKVTAWHVGLAPQVDYVEGCS